MENKLPSREFLNELFVYNNGQLITRSTRGGVMSGSIAGSFDKSTGYYRVSILGKRYKVHRIIWAMFNGEIKSGYQIDHIDLNKKNNKIENLRLVTNSENCIARTVKTRVDNSSGHSGVSFIKKINKYQSTIFVEGKTVWLGYFSTIKDAIQARENAEKEYGYCQIHNKINQ